MLVFVAALRRELAGIQQLLEVDRRTELGQALAVEGRVNGLPVVLVQSGIGRERSVAATQAALDRYKPASLLSVGFSGGLNPLVKGADVIVGERLESGDGGSFAPDARLYAEVTQAMETDLMPFHRGALVSMPEVMPGPKEKVALLVAHPRAKAVDMESYWVGVTAQAAQVPFLAVRTASDGPGQTLPNYEVFLDEMGEVKPLSAAWYYVSHPWHLSAAPGLAANASRGAKRLAAFVDLFFLRVYRGAAALR